MKTPLLVMVVVLGLALPPAAASRDPVPDSIGVYFDAAATRYELEPPLFTAYQVFLVLTNPTAAVDGFECTVTRRLAASLVLTTDLGEGASDADPLLDGYLVTRPTPYPVADGVVVLVRWQWMQLNWEVMPIFVGPGTVPTLPGGLPVLRLGPAFRQGNVAQGAVPGLVACVNCQPYAAEVSSFGAIKGLYR